jgi:aspartyl/glutamyl-tRNA(Asn/Gln) amidotransferase C subunit
MTILNEVNTDGVEPTAQVTGLHNVVRSDEVVPSPLRDKLMATMPRVTAEELPVPGVFE